MSRAMRVSQQISLVHDMGFRSTSLAAAKILTAGLRRVSRRTFRRSGSHRQPDATMSLLRNST